MSADESISVEFELTPEEWAEAGTAHTLASPLTIQATQRVRGLFVLICVLLAILQVLQGEVTMALAWVAGGFIGQSAFPWILARSQRSHLHRFSKAGVVNGLFGPHRIELSPEGIRNVTSGYDCTTRWSAVERVEESDGTFMVYTGPNAFLPIPSSAFRDAETLRKFSRAFYSYLESADDGPLALNGLVHSLD